MSNTIYPGSLDPQPTDPTATNFLNSPPHHLQHGFANDAIIAIQGYLGVIGSAITSSLTYLVTNVLSIDPGHKHTSASVNLGPLTAHNVLVGAGANINPTLIAPGPAGTFLTSNGSSSDPSYQSASQTKVFSTFTANEAISAGAAVAASLYQTDGGVLFDNSTSANFASNGTVAFTVGNNSNRILVAILIGTGSSNTPTAPTYNGVSFTNVLSNTTTNCQIAVYYLIAPATGSNTFAFGTNGVGSTAGGYALFSYYNAKQTSPIDNSTSAVSNTTTFNPSTLGDLMLGFSACNGSISTFNSLNNTVTGNRVGGGDWGELFPKVTTTITASNNSGSQITGAVAILPFSSPSLDGAQNASSALANARSSAFVGFAQGSASAGGTIAVTTGGVATGLSGLSPGAQLYLNNTPGSVGASPGTQTRKVGIALDTTSVLVTNIW